METFATPTSALLFDEAARLFPGGVNSPVRAFKGVGGSPLFMDSGKGAWVTDADGNRYVDYVLGYGPHVHGHADDRIVSAIREAAGKGTGFGAPGRYENELARLIQSFVPSMEMMRFVTSGTEAVMSVLRLARAATGRESILKFDGNYHGHSDAVLARAGSGVATLGLPDSPGVPAAATKNTLVVRYNDLAAVASAFDAAKGEIAAVVVEPVAGNMGVVNPDAGFLQGLRDITSAHGSLLVFDEVMTGFRVHRGGAQALHGVVPDLTTLGKVIGGGLPVGAYGGRADLMRHIAPEGAVYQAGTLAGNPVVMAAGIAALELLADDEVWTRALHAVSELTSGLVNLAADNGLAVQVPHAGTMFSVFFNPAPVRNFDDARASSADLYRVLFHEMLSRGVSLPPSAYESWFVSTSHDAQAVRHTLAAAAAAFTIVRERSAGAAPT
jgi:glutamate-1-semialdehyde 2,1-aminomutase